MEYNFKEKTSDELLQMKDKSTKKINDLALKMVLSKDLQKEIKFLESVERELENRKNG